MAEDRRALNEAVSKEEYERWDRDGKAPKIKAPYREPAKAFGPPDLLLAKDVDLTSAQGFAAGREVRRGEDGRLNIGYRIKYMVQEKGKDGVVKEKMVIGWMPEAEFAQLLRNAQGRIDRNLVAL